MECRRAEELFSDHLEGTLHEILRGELDAHLASCVDCRALRAALEEVVSALRAYPALEPPLGLSQRAAAAVLASRWRPPVARPALVVPAWVQAAAAGFALIALGGLLMVVGPERPTRAAQRLVGQTVSAGNNLIERKDRLVEDVRVLGVVLSTAFEGRLDRVNERLEDYRRLIERQRPAPGEGDSKRGSGSPPLPSAVASAFRTGGRPSA
ncbi:MAG TPA: zf-HC2 domain-containing protein [Vicinamibacteria bacterium]|nr:zf-HC2 domain-containing protein [Vicinamibacteria bacterium]